MILGDVMVPGKHLKCEQCTWDWVSVAKTLPENCPNPDCRSREWNGKKRRKGSRIALPKPIRVRGERDDEF